MLFTLLESSNPLQVVRAMDKLHAYVLAERLGAFSNIAGALAALFCAIVLIKLSSEYMNGEAGSDRLTLWEVLRPIVLLLLCCNFQSFVIKPFHGILKVCTDALCEQANVSWEMMTDATVAFSNSVLQSHNDKIVELYDEALSDGTVSASEVTEENLNFFQRFGNSIEDFASGAWTGIKTAGSIVVEAVRGVEDYIFSGFINLINALMFMIMKFIMMGQQLYAYVYLIFLGLLGPFVFAFGIFPGYSSNINTWISRYVHIMFWIPIGQLIIMVNYEIMRYSIELSSEYYFGQKYISLVAGIICLMNICAVPKLAAFMIESSGTNGAHSAVNASFKQAANTMINFGQKITSLVSGNPAGLLK